MTDQDSPTLLQWLDNISISNLVVVALLLGLAPFQPEPHLWQKLKMLSAGGLVRPLDIFDLFLHGTPVLLLCIRLVRVGMKNGSENAV